MLLPRDFLKKVIFGLIPYFATVFLVAGTEPIKTDILANKPHFLANSPINFLDFQKEELAKEFPAKDIFLTPEKKLWFIGKNSLWFWDIKNLSLKKITLDKVPAKVFNEEKEFIYKLNFDGTNLLAASDTALFQIGFSPIKVFKYFNPFYKQGKTINFSTNVDKTWWIHEDGIFFIDRYGKKISLKYPDPGFQKNDRAIFDGESDFLWIVRNQKFLKYDLSKKTVPESILESKYPFIDIQNNADTIFVATNHAVLLFNKAGSNQQIVPVNGQHKLLQMFITEKWHCYLFDDFGLEIFNLTDKTTLQTKLPLSAGTQISNLQVVLPYVALLAGGRPLVWELSNNP